MVEKDLVVKEKLEHSGLFDFASFYSFAHGWFKERGFGVDEERYSEKTDGNKKDIDILWKASKNFSDYFRIEYELKFEVKELTNVEAEIDGQKRKMNKGRVALEIKGILIMDRESKWETSPLSRFMRDVYNKYIVPTRVNHMKNFVEEGAVGVKEELKAFLELSGRRGAGDFRI